MRRAAFVLLAAVASCTTSSQTTTTFTPMAPGAAREAGLAVLARDIHERVFTVDTHVDIPARWSTTPDNDADSGTAQVTFRKMKAGGLDGAFFAVYVGQGARTPAGDSSAKAQAMQKFNGIHRSVDTLYKDKVEIAYQPEDVPRIQAKGKLVAAIGIENGWVIGHDLTLIQKYYNLGARYMTLAHTSNNDICDSSTDRNGPEHHGLSAFGKTVVAEMNRVGMMVDVSHVSKECMMQATALSKSPVIGSHSSTTFVANVPRNMDDEMLRGIKANNGVVQMVAYATYVKAPVPARDSLVAALNAEFYPPDSAALVTAAANAPGRGVGGGAAAAAAATGATVAGQAGGGGRGRGRGNRPPLSPERQVAYDKRMGAIETQYPSADVKMFVDHIDHAIAVAGIDHVGISSDFDGGGGIKGWKDATETFNVTLELVRRGYTEEQIRKLWSGNTLRVWGDNTRLAAH